MSLSHALLGLLAVAPASGYELTKEFERDLGRYAWQAGHTSIYPELGKLAARGLVHVTHEGRGARAYDTARPGRGAALVLARRAGRPCATSGAGCSCSLRWSPPTSAWCSPDRRARTAAAAKLQVCLWKEHRDGPHAGLTCSPRSTGSASTAVRLGGVDSTGSAESVPAGRTVTCADGVASSHRQTWAEPGPNLGEVPQPEQWTTPLTDRSYFGRGAGPVPGPRRLVIVDSGTAVRSCRHPRDHYRRAPPYRTSVSSRRCARSSGAPTLLRPRRRWSRRGRPLRTALDPDGTGTGPGDQLSNGGFGRRAGRRGGRRRVRTAAGGGPGAGRRVAGRATGARGGAFPLAGACLRGHRTAFAATGRPAGYARVRRLQADARADPGRPQRAVADRAAGGGHPTGARRRTARAGIPPVRAAGRGAGVPPGHRLLVDELVEPGPAAGGRGARVERADGMPPTPRGSRAIARSWAARTTSPGWRAAAARLTTLTGPEERARRGQRSRSSTRRRTPCSSIWPGAVGQLFATVARRSGSASVPAARRRRGLAVADRPS